ncbi:MAG: ammonium transporter, partial [Caldilineaceae bacterium]|nr:ammonium transporter [Caldilineaceae bacterium]
AVAGLAAGPFVQPGAAFIIGLIAGATTPFVMYLTNHVLRLEDRTGVLHMCAAPAIIGLFMVGLWADGVEGNGWQATGAGTYLGVPGQGVSGLLVANGLSVDFPGQLQAQVVGILALGLWGFLGGLIVCVPLSLLYYGLQRSAETGHQSLESELLS